MSEQFNSLEEKSRHIEISLKYTNKDMDKAKAMAAGQLQDIIVVKGKFVVHSKNNSGMFYAFFNSMFEYIASIDSIIFSTPHYFEKIRIFDEWKTLSADIRSYRQKNEAINSVEFTGYLLDAFINRDIFPHVQDKRIDQLTKIVNEIIADSFNDKNVQSQVEIEQTSSLNMELAGIQIDVPGGIEVQGAPETEKNVSASQSSELDQRLEKIESEADYIVSGQVIVSPIKGKYIHDIEPGDKIKIMLPGFDAVSQKILKALNAYDKDGNKLPIKGRVKAKVPVEKGCIVYALVAKGIVAKIIEEEDVKIQMDAPEEESTVIKSFDNKLIVYILILILLIVVTGFVLFSLI